MTTSDPSRRTPPWARALGMALALALPIAGGCGEDPDLPKGVRKKIAVDEIPEPIRAAAQKALPGIKFTEAWKNLDREQKLHSYEIKGRSAKGKIREARVSLTGEILELE
jgi:hypothetical protein